MNADDLEHIVALEKNAVLTFHGRMKVASVETFSNGAGTRIVLHLQPSRTLSSASIPVESLPETLQAALLDWLNQEVTA